MSNRTEWISTASILRSAWEHLFTSRGGGLLLIAWLIFGILWGEKWDSGLAAYVVGFIAFPFLAFFFIVSCAIVSSLSEFFTDQLLGRRLNVKLTHHQVAYFLLSCVFTAVGFLILLSATMSTVPFIP